MRLRLGLPALLAFGLASGMTATDLLDGAQLQRGVGQVEFFQRDGKKMIRLTGKTPQPRPNGNAYLKFRLKLERPVSLSGRAVRFRVETGNGVRVLKQGEERALAVTFANTLTDRPVELAAGLEIMDYRDGRKVLEKTLRLLPGPPPVLPVLPAAPSSWASSAL